MANKARWNERNKREALRLIDELRRKIEQDQLTVITVGFWTAGTSDTHILRIDMKDSQFIPILNTSE